MDKLCKHYGHELREKLDIKDAVKHHSLKEHERHHDLDHEMKRKLMTGY